MRGFTGDVQTLIPVSDVSFGIEDFVRAGNPHGVGLNLPRALNNLDVALEYRRTFLDQVRIVGRHVGGARVVPGSFDGRAFR